MTQKVTDEMLMAFVDGETDAATTAMIERALAGNAALAARAQQLRAGRTLVRDAFGGARDEPVPKALVEAIRKADTDATVIAFPTRRALRFALPLAASVALAFGLGGYWAGQATTGVTDPLARSAIAGALAGTGSGESRALDIAGGEATFRTLATYRIDNGLCRSFDLTGPDLALSGVGCDRGAGWNLDLAVAGASGGGLYAPASDAALQSIDAYLDAMEASSALTAEEEEQALRR